MEERDVPLPQPVSELVTAFKTEVETKLTGIYRALLDAGEVEEMGKLLTAGNILVHRLDSLGTRHSWKEDRHR